MNNEAQTNTKSYKEVYLENQKAWAEVEELVLTYQKRFNEDVTNDEIEASERAGEELYERFYNLFSRYASLVKTGNIRWQDKNMKKFVSLFMSNRTSQLALSRTKSSSKSRKNIHKEFSFIVDTYGQLPEEDIISDLHTAFAILLKRYKQSGRTFCGYVNNAFHFYFYRQVVAHTKDPASILSKMNHLDAEIQETLEVHSNGLTVKEEDDTYEHNLGVPDMKWITGEACSDLFKELSSLQRQIIVKYYLERWSDKQIADAYAMHPNGIGRQRHRAIEILAKSSGIGRQFIRRIRNSGKEIHTPK